MQRNLRSNSWRSSELAKKRPALTTKVVHVRPMEHDYSTRSNRNSVTSTALKVRIIDERQLPAEEELEYVEGYDEYGDEYEQGLPPPPWMCKEEIVVTDPVSQTEEFLVIENQFLEDQERMYFRHPVRRQILPARRSVSVRPAAKLEKREMFIQVDPDVNTNWSSTDGSNKTLCVMCRFPVQVNARKMHVYRYHLNQPLYECPYCEHYSTYHASNVKTHMRIHHGIPKRMASPNNRKKDYEDQIATLMHSCFGDDRMFLRTVPQSVREVVDYLVSTVSNPAIELPRPSQSISGQKSALKVVEDGDIVCNLCNLAGIKQRGRHILQHHVIMPVFRCPHCDYSTTYAASSVKDHLRSQHPEDPDAKPLDFRNHYQERIDSFFTQCFY